MIIDPKRIYAVAGSSHQAIHGPIILAPGEMLVIADHPQSAGMKGVSSQIQQWSDEVEDAYMTLEVSKRPKLGLLNDPVVIGRKLAVSERHPHIWKDGALYLCGIPGKSGSYEASAGRDAKVAYANWKATWRKE